MLHLLPYLTIKIKNNNKYERPYYTCAMMKKKTNKKKTQDHNTMLIVESFDQHYKYT